MHKQKRGQKINISKWQQQLQLGGKLIGCYNFLLYILGIYKLSTIDVNFFYPGIKKSNASKLKDS